VTMHLKAAVIRLEGFLLFLRTETSF